MGQPNIHECKCPICQSSEDHPTKRLHYEMNLFISRLNEQQRRWYVALEAKKMGHGGSKFMSMVTGVHVETIRRGKRELANDLQGRPIDRVRLPGAGRPRRSSATDLSVTTEPS